MNHPKLLGRSRTLRIIEHIGQSFVSLPHQLVDRQIPLVGRLSTVSCDARDLIEHALAKAFQGEGLQLAE